MPRLYGALSETTQVYSHYNVFSDRLADFANVISVSRGHDLGWEIELEQGFTLKLRTRRHSWTTGAGSRYFDTT